MSEVTLPIEARTVAPDFESFFRAEYRSLYQALVLLVGDALEAEEIAQAVLGAGRGGSGPRTAGRRREFDLTDHAL